MKEVGKELSDNTTTYKAVSQFELSLDEDDTKVPDVVLLEVKRLYR